MTAHMTPARAIRRVTGDLAHLLTPQARRWVVGWLVGTAARGMPMPNLFGLPSDGDSYGPTAFDATGVYAEWDFPADWLETRADIRGSASLDIGPGSGRYWWFTEDLYFAESYYVEVTLDGPTTARIVTILRYLEAA